MRLDAPYPEDIEGDAKVQSGLLERRCDDKATKKKKDDWIRVRRCGAFNGHDVE
jgi:hypothetical protein